MARPAGLLTLAAAILAAGCCLPAGTGEWMRRDTPELAVEALKRAFAEDDLRAQYEALHPDLTAREGISETAYRIKHAKDPALFRTVADALAAAGPPVVEHGPEPVATSAGPRPWARVRMEAPGGRRAVVLVVDDPGYLLVTDDPDFPEKPGSLADMGRVARVEGGHLVVEARIPLGEIAPADGAAVHRVEFRHRWLLWEVEVLEGFDELVRRAAAPAGGAQGGNR